MNTLILFTILSITNIMGSNNDINELYQDSLRNEQEIRNEFIYSEIEKQYK